MNNNVQKTIPSGKYSSLSRSLVFWFLLLSTLPLAIVSYISYQQTSITLKDDISKKLSQSSTLNVRFIKNWFKYRFMDINIQAESNENVKLLTTLINGFSKSKKSLSDYVKSYDWNRRVDGLQDNLISLSRRYDYIYDLFLFDSKGNLLFTVAREADFGTNMFTGPYAKTLFSRSIKNTLETGHVHFSDMERYAPSNNIISGFITAPLLDEFGNKLGVFAIQIRVDKIFDVVSNVLNKDSSLAHYLVGEDGKLRTAIKNNEDDVLIRSINTEQFKLWQKEHSEKYEKKHEHDLKDISMDEFTFEYLGPDGKKVIGQHQALNIPGVNWVLISEVDKDEAFASASWLFNLMLVLFLLTVFIVTLWAIYQAKRITKPIIQLVDASLAATKGDIKKRVVVNANNEVAQLADVFNYMLDVRRRHEEELEQTTAQAEMAFLELSEQKFALDQHSIVAITDVKGTIKFANKKFCEISGYTEEELIGQNHRILKSGIHDDEFYRDLYRTIARGDVWHNEVCNKAKDGHLYWLDSTVIPFMGKDAKPKSYITIRTDITERKKAETELVNAKEAAESATQQKSEFLANMSHEIRTPMNGVIGMTGLLLDTSLDPKQRDYAQNTMRSAESLLAIINDILDFSKIEAGKLELEILPFNLQALMEDISELMAIKCREKNIEMLLRFKLGTEKNVIGDPGRVRQILLNLLSNAIKFTEEGNILLTVSSEIISDIANISVSVTDSGIGIDDDKLDKIFNKFDQEDGSTTRKYGGTGLGLAICRQLCQLMEGDISVESQKGHGSVFSFTMKLPLTDKETISSIKMVDTDNLHGLKTLIVDDLNVAQTIICEQLSSFDMNIETADSAKIALDKLRAAITDEAPFNVVISDFHMPEMDGEMLAAEIKKQQLLENGALLFITSSPRKGDGTRLTKLGFDGYLTKPTRSLEVPHIISLIWNAKQERKNIPLVTRHMIKEVKTGNKKKFKLKNAHILLAEDNPVNQMVATEYLERYGCTVSPAGNGLEAVAEIKNSNFDLIFMDCQMPEMDGYEATVVIREWEKMRKISSTPIVAFTANAMQGDREKCLDVGMDDYISKPVSEKSLEEILKKWLPDKVEIFEFDYGKDDFSEDNKEKNKPVKLNDVTSLDPLLEFSVFNTLKEMFGDAFSDAVESHFKSATENIKLIEAALVNNDANALEHAAHSLKGASGQFGAMQLSELAKQMEQFAKDGDIEKAKGILDALIEIKDKSSSLMREKI